MSTEGWQKDPSAEEGATPTVGPERPPVAGEALPSEAETRESGGKIDFERVREIVDAPISEEEKPRYEEGWGAWVEDDEIRARRLEKELFPAGITKATPEVLKEALTGITEQMRDIEERLETPGMIKEWGEGNVTWSKEATSLNRARNVLSRTRMSIKSWLEYLDERQREDDEGARGKEKLAA